MQAGDHLAVCEVVAFKEAIHESLVGLGHGFLQGVVEFGDNGELVIGDGNFHPLQVLHLVGALVQHIDDAGDLLGGVPDGNHNGSDLVAVFFPEGFKGGVVVGVILIYLGDVDEAGHIALLAVLPCLLKAHGDAVLGGAHQNGGICGAQGFHHGAGEVEGTGGIQKVNLGVLILQRCHGGRDGDVAADFLGIIVANGVAVGILAHTVDGTGHVKQTLGQGSLAAAAVAQKTDISDRVNSVHGDSFSFREGICLPLVTIRARAPEY